MATANDENLTVARITERTVGTWTARLEVDTETALDPSVTFEIDGETWTGTVVRGELDAGRYRCRMVGGAGGLQAPLQPLWYDSGPTVRLLLSDILGAGGETLSDESDPAIVTRTLNAYHRGQGTVAEELALLVNRVPGATWRMLRDGTVWVGVDTFPELDARDVDIETDPMPEDGRYEIAPESPVVYPGVTYNGRCVTEVVTYLEGTKLRQELICVSDNATSEPLEKQIARRIDKKLDYTRPYTAKVLAQHGNTVDLMPEDERMKGQGITRVPIRMGMPGVEVTFPPGAIVLLGWENADRSKPYATCWPFGAALSAMTILGDVTIEGSLRVEGDASVVNMAADEEVTALNLTPFSRVTLSKHLHTVPVPPGGQSAPPTSGT